VLPQVSAWTAAAVGLLALGAVLRFGTIGLQSYHHDEVITAHRVLSGSFGDMLHEVRVSESTPPLYYILAWLWSGLFGLHEVGLRSLSALFGVAAIPVAFLIGRELAGRRAGWITAAIVTVNPMLIWYSQEARAYSLLVLLSACSVLFFLRFRRSRDSRDLALWAVASALALATHYFAALPIAIEAVWLAGSTRLSRSFVAACAGMGVSCAALVPLLADQMNPHHINWIDHSPMQLRLLESGAAAFIGETGKVIGAQPRNGYAIFPALLAAAALLVVALWGSRRERRGAAIGFGIGAGVVGLALGAALAGKDYLLARNLLPALIPLLAAVGAALAASRARRVGMTLAVLLCGYSLAFDVYVAVTPSLERPDFEAVADAIGPAHGPRVVVSWALAGTPLQYYLGDDTHRAGHGVWPLHVRELDVVGKHYATTISPRLARRFGSAQRISIGRLAAVRYRSARALDVHYRQLKPLRTGFQSDSVLTDGFRKPPPALPAQVTIAGRSAPAGRPTG
jgi:4-amino-4-deoxy-L-arabinose transferase-like glycosyltransferase